MQHAIFPSFERKTTPPANNKGLDGSYAIFQKFDGPHNTRKRQNNVPSDHNIFASFDKNNTIQGLLDPSLNDSIANNEQPDSLPIEHTIQHTGQDVTDMVEGAPLNGTNTTAAPAATDPLIIDRARQDGYDDGFNKGYQEATQKFDAKLLEKESRRQEFIEQLADNYTKFVSELEGLQHDMHHYLSSAFGEIAHELLPNLIEHNLARTIPDIVRDNLSILRAKPNLHIHLTAEDKALYHDDICEIIIANDSTAKLEFIEDASLKSGDICIDWPHGQLCHSHQQLKNDIKELFYQFFKYHQQESDIDNDSEKINASVAKSDSNNDTVIASNTNNSDKQPAILPDNMDGTIE